MKNIVQKYLLVESRTKFYSVLVLTSLTLFFYSIWEIKWVVVDITDFLGLTSHLTAAYWIGLGLITLCSVLVYLDNELKNEWVFIFTLIVVGVFLFGLGVFAEENARFPWSYYPAGEAKMLLSTHHIDTISPYPLISYHCWPASHFISASIILLTGINFDNLIQYMPLFWFLYFIFISFAIGRRLNFSLNHSFLLSFLSLSSFWTFHYYYGAQSFAILIYLLLFMFIITFGDTIKETLPLILTFTALVITHMLTTMTALSALFVQSLYKRQTKFILLFLAIFAGWYIYLAPLMFEAGVKEFFAQATALDFFSFLRTEKYSTGTLLTRQVVHTCRITYLGIYATCMAIAAILYLTGRVKKENKKRLGICFSWLIGVVLLLVLRYGATEIDDRVFVLSLIPMACIMILSFNRKVFVVLMVLLIMLHIPAHYGTECFDMARTTELEGAEFFAMKISPDEPYFYKFGTYIQYYNHSLVLIPAKTFMSRKGMTSRENIDFSILNTKYIIISKQVENMRIYAYGYDFNNYLENVLQSEINKKNLIYTNGNFKIYKRAEDVKL